MSNIVDEIGRRGLKPSPGDFRVGDTVDVHVRIVEGDNYVNVMRDADWEDSHTRLPAPDERDSVTFMMYEELIAFKRAAETKGLSRAHIEDIFYNTARNLLQNANS